MAKKSSEGKLSILACRGEEHSTASLDSAYRSLAVAWGRAIDEVDCLSLHSNASSSMFDLVPANGRASCEDGLPSTMVEEGKVHSSKALLAGHVIAA